MVDLAGLIGDQLECPICFQTPRSAPIFQCENGHLVCNACKARIMNGKCPQGSCPLAERRSRLAETLLEKSGLPRPCKYSVEGCFFEATIKRLEAHERECGYRKVRCPDLDCFDEIAEREILPHLIEDHFVKEDDFIKEEKAVDSCLWVIEPDDIRVRSVDRTWPISLVKKDGLVFVSYLKKPKNKDVWHAWMQIMGPQSQAECYQGKVTVNTVEKDVLSHQRPMHAIDATPDEVIAKGQTLTFSDAFAGNALIPYPGIKAKDDEEDDDELKYLLKIEYEIIKLE